MNGWLDKMRLTLIALFLVLGLTTLITRLWSLQINRRDYYLSKIPKSSSVTVRVPPTRGRIFDRNGVLLVDNEIGYSVTLNLEEVVRAYKARNQGDLPEVSYEVTRGGNVRSAQLDDVNIVEVVKATVIPKLKELGLAANFNARKLEVFYRTHRGLLPFPYRDDLTFEEYARFAEHASSLPGVNVHAVPKRKYVYGALASHILGTMRKSATGDLPEDERGLFNHYLPDSVGSTGIEQSMEDYLRGTAGKRVVKKNEKLRVVGEVRYDPPVAGGDLYLTLDAEFQYLAEQLMRNVGRGAAVVMDVENGDIVAMASVPSFDPNDFIPSISAERWKAYNQDPTHPLFCTALGTYAPGSTYKLVMGVAAALENQCGASHNCIGGVQYGRHFKKCWIHSKGGSHGVIGLRESLQRSCNSYYYLMSKAIGQDPMVTAAELMGLGRTSGIELAGEDPGIVMGSRYWTDVVRRTPDARMTSAELANMSIGQGETKASPIQIANVVAAIANGGRVLQPRLVNRVVAKKDNSLLYPVGERANPDAPTVLADLKLEGVSDEELAILRGGMYDVVNKYGGTARGARIEGVGLSGKTGSAQTSIRGRRGTHAWFTAFAPYERPKYAVCVVVLGGESGGAVAAPIARELIDGIFKIERDRILGDGKRQAITQWLAPAVGGFDAIARITFEEDGSSVVELNEPDAEEPVMVERPAALPQIRVPRVVSEEDVTIADTPDEEGTVVRRAKPVDPEVLRRLMEQQENSD
ncbi:penicillin-binding transpeptidase domain-containing protein [Sulfuriroseicoccus oceanibius]|uniref:Penicillin-binding protein 2 n=1 Tax=Sulfuriroseicoccus oceanibius TaxID=2707525 RepID=A0A7T7JB74_9BACT|nr:penicillin-binding transpeptidase domain-containing protein [Sulfuriroseicoccus oceanibius]QQL43749.1 hypothetical protein G3M56_007495 [Sulfuriroseicoccus oceanibius]